MMSKRIGDHWYETLRWSDKLSDVFSWCHGIAVAGFVILPSSGCLRVIVEITTICYTGVR